MNPIAILRPIIDEGPTFDTEVNMTRCVAVTSPVHLSRLNVAVYHLKSTCPSQDERIDAISYFFRHGMFNLN